MAARPKGQNKRDHVVTATDAEWARLGEAADAAGMSRSRFILHAVNAWRTSRATRDDRVPAPVFRRMLQTVLVLERLEQQRLKERGAEHLWYECLASADARIDTEAAGMWSSELGQHTAVEFGSLPASLLRMVVRAVLVIELLERQRLKIRHAEDLWRDFIVKAETWIGAETTMG